MSVTSEQIRAALARVEDPRSGAALAITAGNSDIHLDGNGLSLLLALGHPLHNRQTELRKRIETAVRGLGLELKDGWLEGAAGILVASGRKFGAASELKAA